MKCLIEECSTKDSMDEDSIEARIIVDENTGLKYLEIDNETFPIEESDGKMFIRASFDESGDGFGAVYGSNGGK